MEAVRFTDTDAAILFCLPEAGCNLRILLRVYCFTGRVAVPDYVVVAECLRRAVHAGIMDSPSESFVRLKTAWREAIHRRDSQFESFEEAMGEFSDRFVACTFPRINHSDFVLDRELIDLAANAVRSEHDRLFNLPD